MINPKMAGILGMDQTEDEIIEKEVIEVEPHELVTIDNPDLPVMSDIDRRQLQAEKQLEEVIQSALGFQKSLFDEVSSVEPKYRSRYIEVANGTMALALDAIKAKLKTQHDHRKQRMEQAGFKNERSSNDGPGQTNNFFVGSREELREMLKNLSTDHIDAEAIETDD